MPGRFPGALDALTGIAVKGPCVLMAKANVACMTSHTAQDPVARSVVHLAHWRSLPIQLLQADAALFASSHGIAFSTQLRVCSEGTEIGEMGFTIIAGLAGLATAMVLVLQVIFRGPEFRGSLPVFARSAFVRPMCR